MLTLQGYNGAFSEGQKPILESLTFFYLLPFLSSEILIHQKYLFRYLQSLQLCATPFLSAK